MLARVAMPDPESVLRRYPHQLSGGMLQRSVIAMALITDPELLILDEPTTALDVTTQAVVLDLVQRLKREFDSSILYITHDLAVVSKLCDRVGVMYAGEFCEQAEMRTLYKRPLHPYTLSLLGCVPRFEREAGKRLLTSIPGMIPRLDELPRGCVFAPRCAFVREECTLRRPPLVEVQPGHFSACIRWNELPTAAEYARAAQVIPPHRRRAARGASGPGPEEKLPGRRTAVQRGGRRAEDREGGGRRDPLGPAGQHPGRGGGKRVRKDHDAARGHRACAPHRRGDHAGRRRPGCRAWRSARCPS